jgi:hypothetical protein
MNQSTAHGPALARRSHGVSVPGAPMRATFTMRALPPAVARSGQHVGYSPSRGLAGRTPIRDGRFPVGLPTGRSSSRDTLCQLHAGRTRAADSTKRQPIAVAFRLMPPGIFQ